MMERLCDERYNQIADCLNLITEQAAKAAQSSGRSLSDIIIMAVTKTVSVAEINAALSMGVSCIGENKAQELFDKAPHLNAGPEKIHFIGHLQTNKVKKIVDKVSMIQSVDSVHLAKEIGRLTGEKGMEVLLEVNVGGEASKSGVAPEQVYETLDEIRQIPKIRVMGLMAIPPVEHDPGKAGNNFAKMHNLFLDIKTKKMDNIDMKILSMGMSGDFQQAILEGSNFIRIGSAIFGARK